MRVIAGEYRGRRLKSLEGKQTRPTTDKVKEAVFSMIGPYFDGGTCLDLYSGSGGLAIEALSRGMKEAYCIDHHYQAIKVIKENMELVGCADRAVILKQDANQALQQFAAQHQSFDLIFLDPPYAKQEIEQQLTFIMENHLLSDMGIIMCEVDAKTVELPDEIAGLYCRRRATYGITQIVLYEKDE